MIEKFKQYLINERGFSPNTILAYIEDVDQFLEFNKDKEVNLENIEKWISCLKIRNKPSTTKRKIMSVRSYVKSHDPKNEWVNYVSSVKKENKTLNFLDEDQIRSLLCKCKNIKDSLIIKIMAESGLRASELVCIKIADVNLARREILVRGKGGIDRVVPITMDCEALLSQHASSLSCNKKELLFKNKFNNPLTRQSVTDLIIRLSNKAGIPNVTSHTLRRSCATNLLNKGINIDLISRLLGHKDKNSVEAYLIISLDKLKCVHKKYHPEYSLEGDIYEK